MYTDGKNKRKIKKNPHDTSLQLREMNFLNREGVAEGATNRLGFVLKLSRLFA